MSKLVFIGEKFGGRVYEFVPEKTTVGRGDQNTLVIRDDSVSNIHCEILVNGPEVIVHDLGSANGTYVNGVRIQGQCQVKDGQLVRFGSVEARLDLGLRQWEDTATEETAVFAMQRIMRDQRREKKTPKPLDPSMTLEAESRPELGDHTVLMTRPTPPPEALAPASPGKTSAPSKGNIWRVIITFALLAAGTVLLCWFVSRKK
ncbi:MAG: hypothetical protein QOF48_3656 [Verrucomicrobiota bacterium]|jgi:predicted component of type VI protein secretion system